MGGRRNCRRWWLNDCAIFSVLIAIQRLECLNLLYQLRNLVINLKFEQLLEIARKLINIAKTCYFRCKIDPSENFQSNCNPFHGIMQPIAAKNSRLNLLTHFFAVASNYTTTRLDTLRWIKLTASWMRKTLARHNRQPLVCSASSHCSVQ